MQNNWVMDIEVMSDFFCAVFEHYKTDNVEVFTVSFKQNDFDKLIEFLEETVKKNEWHISFNGLDFDAQIIQYLIDKRDSLKSLNYKEFTKKVYITAQDVINRKQSNSFALYRPKDILIRQIDLFKLNHWDNPAKSSSLKWLEYTMDWYNVEEMPIHHTDIIDTDEKQEMVISYCKNDVKFTKKIMEASKEQIILRVGLSSEYGIDLYSASEPRISKELFKYFLAKKIGMSAYEISQLRTKRDKIKVKNIILPYVKFETPALKDLLAKFNDLEIDANNTKGAFSYSVDYKGMETDFGLGGLHGARQGIIEAEKGMRIVTADVVSYYPNLAIKNKWSPAHLPKEDFCEQYEWFFTERKKIPKKDPKNYVYKIILNSTYGLSNDANSFLYDPELTMRITINGQLSLMMLYEMIAEGIPGSIPIMQNTDGLEFLIPNETYDKYIEICKQWEKITQLELEFDEYEKMIIGDVNNYIAVFKERKAKDQQAYEELKKDEPYYVYMEDLSFKPVKCKGRFEFHKLALHKNKSFLIIRKALYHYFVNRIPVEKTIKESKNIMDFCGGVKAKSTANFVSMCMINQQLVETKLNKIVRYYISKKGCKIIKKYKDGRLEQVEAGRWMQTLFNKVHDVDWNNINYDYYISNAIKEIVNISPERVTYQQTKLEL